MKIFIITALLVISYVAASPMLTEEEEFDLLDRVARAAKNKEAKDHWKNFVNSKGKTIKASEVKCPKGKKAEIEKDENGDLLSLRCVKCEEGKYTLVKGLFDSCSSCPEGKSTLAGKNDKCIDLCPAGKGYVSKPTKGRPRCMACEDDTYNDGDGLECKPCPEFHKVKKSDMKRQNKTATKSECKLEKCPDGFIKTKDDNCKPCGHGNFTNLKGDECQRCNKSKPFTLSNANKGGKACFALANEDEKSCYEYMFDALKEYGPKMKEKKEENKDEEGIRDDDDLDEGGPPSGGQTGSGPDDDSRKTGGQGSDGQSPKRKKRAAQAGDKKSETKQTKKEKKALAKEEKEKKEKKEKQERGKSLRSAICKGKGSLDDLRTKFRECKALEAEKGKKLIPEFAKVNNGKMVEIKDILEKEDGVDANCKDVDEDEEDLNRCGTGYQSSWHSSSGHISSGPGGSSRPGGSSGSSGSSGAGRSSGPGGSSRPGGSSGSSGSSGAGRSSGPGGSSRPGGPSGSSGSSGAGRSSGPGGSSGPGSSSGSSSGMSGPPQSGGGAGGGAIGGGKPGSGGRARR